jgi:hypothetical protein
MYADLEKMKKYQREYGIAYRARKKEELRVRKEETRRKIAAAILVAEHFNKQP